MKKNNITIIEHMKKQISANLNEIARLQNENVVLNGAIKGVQSNKGTFDTHLEMQEPDTRVLGSVDRGDYPTSGTAAEKIVYIVRNIGRLSKIQDIKTGIHELEGSVDGAKVMKSLSHHIRKLIADRQLFINRVGGSNKYTFYAVPDFFDNEFELKPGYEPLDEAWADYDKSKRVINPKEWKEVKAKK
jgi:hypothetical protein